MKTVLRSRWTKVLLFIVCLVPAALLYKHEFGGPYPPPLEVITHASGDWTIWFLALTLTITPLRALLNEPLITRYRRMLGLFAFFYGCLHFSVWLWLDKDFDLRDMWADILKRRYITVGMLALTLLIPLAITSTAGWVRRLGYRRWQMLHRLIYFSAVAALIHYYWLVKSDETWPLIYIAVFSVLMIYRFVLWSRASTRSAKPPAAPATRPSEPESD
jgi:methionine sulfoxide reductase heme-binding subunit